MEILIFSIVIAIVFVVLWIRDWWLMDDFKNEIDLLKKYENKNISKLEDKIKKIEYQLICKHEHKGFKHMFVPSAPNSGRHGTVMPVCVCSVCDLKLASYDNKIDYLKAQKENIDEFSTILQKEIDKGQKCTEKE